MDQLPAPPSAPLSPAAAAGKPGCEPSESSAANQGADNGRESSRKRSHLLGNAHRQTHGVRSFLALGRLPKGASYIRRLMGEFRRELEQRVGETHGGEVSLTKAALITTAARHEGRALLLSRYLALEGDGLKTLERMSLLDAIGRASDARDRVLEKLDLDRDPNAFDPASFYRTPLTASVLAPPSDDYARPMSEAAPPNNAPIDAVGGHTR